MAEEAVAETAEAAAAGARLPTGQEGSWGGEREVRVQARAAAEEAAGTVEAAVAATVEAAAAEAQSLARQAGRTGEVAAAWAAAMDSPITVINVRIF